MKKIVFISIFAIGLSFGCFGHLIGESTVFKETPLIEEPTELAIFGAGHFWFVEAVFEELDGVISVESGYTGGSTKKPTYRSISSGKTNHAEVVQITFNPKKISLETLLTVFFQVHDPTTLNYQGTYKGEQYRSAIFYTNEDQKKVSRKVITSLNKEKVYPSPIVTELSPSDQFYLAEDYHQNYYSKNMNNHYCKSLIQPKLEKFRKAFEEYLK